MKKTILVYGLISGGISAALMLGSALYMRDRPANFDGAEIFGYASIILSTLFIFLGVRAYREQREGQQFSFGKAFQVGLYITLISCAIYVLTWMILSGTIMSDFMDKYAAYSLQKMQESGATMEEITQKTAEMDRYKELYKNPLTKAAVTFLEPFPIGLLVTLISAAILRRR